MTQAFEARSVTPPHTNGHADRNPASDKVSLFDGYDTVYAIGSTDPEIQESRAARVFDEITERLPWPALLTHDANDVRAVWSAYELPKVNP